VRSGRLGGGDRLSTYNSLIALETRRRNFEQAEIWLYECQSRMGHQLGECGTETIVKGYLINKKFVEASALLISDRDKHLQYHTFGHYPPERRYQVLVYLGQALLEQKNPAPAEQALRQAMQIFENKAPAHCLLAQVFEQRTEAKQEKQAWEQCIAYGRLINAEEATWMNQARQRLAAIGEIEMKASNYFAIVAAFVLVSGSEVGLTQSRSPLATVVSVTGKVEVKQGNAAYRQLRAGETLMQGDLMRSSRRRNSLSCKLQHLGCAG